MNKHNDSLANPALLVRGLLVLCATAVLVLGVVACGGGDPECVNGQACVCQGDCDKTCGGTGGGCSFSCPAGATCTFDCPGGGCSATANSSTSMVLGCLGNSCQATCTGNTGTCAIEACSTGCALSCGGAQTCDSSCDLFGGCAVTP